MTDGHDESLEEQLARRRRRVEAALEGKPPPEQDRRVEHSESEAPPDDTVTLPPRKRSVIETITARRRAQEDYFRETGLTDRADTPPATSGGPSWFARLKRAAPFIGAAAVVVVGLLVAANRDSGEPEAEDNGGDEPEAPLTVGPTSWSTDDPVDDWEPFPDADPINRERERGGVSAAEFQDAADLTGVSASSSAEGTEITVSHAGDAQAVQAASEGSYSQGLILMLSDGSRWEVIFRDDLSVKIVSAPAGATVSHQWITPQQVTFTLGGITLDASSTIEATVYLEIFGGLMVDIVRLIAT